MKGIKTIVNLSISILCILVVVYLVDVENFVSTVKAVGLADFILISILVFFCFLSAFFRFRVVLGIFGYHPPFTSLFLAFSIGQISNQFLLNVVGQSLSRAAILNKAGIPFSISVVVTYIERIIGAVLLFFAALGSAWILFLHVELDLQHGGAYLLYIIAAVILVAFVTSVVYYRTSSSNWMTPSNLRNVNRLWPIVLLSIVTHVFMLAAYLVIFSRLSDIGISPQIIAAFIVVMFAASFPISFSGWGIRELSAVAALGIVGIDSAIAITVAVMVGLVSQIFSFAFVPLSTFLATKTGLNKSNEISEYGFNNVSDVKKPEVWHSFILKGCILFCAAFLFFQVWITVGENRINVNFADVIALTGLGIVIFDMWIRRSIAPLPPLLILVFAGISVILITSLFTGYLRFGPIDWALYNRGLGWIVITGYISMGVSIILVDKEQGRKIVLQTLLVAGVTIAIIQLLASLTWFMGLQFFELRLLRLPLEGFANNSSAYGFQMVLIAVAAIVANRLNMFEKMPHYFYGIMILLAVSIFYSYSRAGYFTYFIVLGLMVITTCQTFRRREIYAALVSGLAFISGYFMPYLISIFNFELSVKSSKIIERLYFNTAQGNLKSDNERWQSIADGLALWLDYPLFGSGLGAFVHAQITDLNTYLVIHSIPVWLLAETGISGFVIVCGLYLLLLIHAFKMLKSRETAPWGFGLAAILICISVAGLVHDFFYQRIFWFMLGLFMTVHPLVKKCTDKSVDRS